MSIQSINPATEELIEEFQPFSAAEIDAALDDARKAFLQWRESSFADRSTLFHRIAGYLRAHKSELARLATLEMGKPIIESEAEVEKCAWNCDYYAENAAHFLADEPIQTDASESYVAFQPLGVILALMPWNFPYWQVFRFAAPALMAGNAAVLKHASNVSRVALEIERIFKECGAPHGLFRTVLVPGSKTDTLIADKRIAAVTLTGSDSVGAQVAAASGRALKKNVLELGGSDAFIVLEDADIDGAAATAARARYQNTGQSCIAAKRFIVVEAVAQEFEEKFAAAASQLRVGDPLDSTTRIGPLARADLRDTLERQVQETLAMGGKLLLGGNRLPRKGYFYETTIIGNVTPAMPIFREETFGPVAAVIRARDANHAIELANDSDFGLGGNLWTRNVERGQQLARRIESGSVFINGMTASDPRLPFGGIKRSGYGRELSSFGIREFTNIKTIWVGPKKEV
ncbi:succinate-semialdehyde dehydrogenase/glutarate-semialdehyde dehydrogenase [Thermosporothrix hazakensis]|uniref:Succinate-semialdehyde dehydrogenase/glutarate-semialdehyde dehydrogenase n=2 Tax=Thermosporothrix TaxID=768650 RepID=A0A326UR34_THEHA|nr:NAD-dependent succinate-semialdehyde dehydrogenase [Thermosporothrix hazakensis]PZW32917.1 succinate-semialdehyde dehydrogenase/glutarate-semialdehyde dehydrogenase [Thermosporothrix hazakensis]BBH90898.1 succinate-semialdehyde dehydrogenase [Thermosporothrix sp. COM3]GCE48949.1 succinate-semialdehyde dehydrogenase [Thermosporothrix hazakensis]